MNKVEVIPKLDPVSRSGEYNSYHSDLRDSVVYNYLFKGKSHRYLDENILGLNSVESRGYQAMGILHYLGLKNQHKGIFESVEIKLAIEKMKEVNEAEFIMVIQALERYIGVREDGVFDSNEEFEYSEGKELYRIHKVRERDPRVIKKAKELFLKKHGSLYCEVCYINFEDKYGERGKDFIEGHHTKPVTEMKAGETTRIKDIAMLCPNCHRMIHREPFVTVEELKNEIQQHRK